MYEEAQKYGENGNDCHLIYSECDETFLQRMTHFNELKNVYN